MRKYIFYCKFIASAACIMLAACSGNNTRENSPDFSFAVLDVGEGLSQIGIAGKSALVWDMGDTFCGINWQKEYELLGSPRIKAIIISHSHRDHIGGLYHLADSIDFTGAVIISPYEDTSGIRNMAGAWRNSIVFYRISQGDTLDNLEGVHIECIWPPKGLDMNIVPDTLKNRYSLCFSIKYGNSSVIITSDIDTFAERNLSSTYNTMLASDIIVVPHHGSAGSVDEVFYGYVNPSVAIISCGLNNEYGFPANRVLNLLYQMKVAEYVTSTAGTVTAASNGYYWTF
jgi:competence protein ComEC